MNKKTIRVLIVEDSKLWAETMIRILEKNDYEVIHDIVSERKDFLECLNHRVYDLILADFNLPQWNGQEAYLALRESGKDIPFVVVTGSLIEEKVIDLLKMGVQDCVLKEHLTRLPITVDRVLKEKQLKDKERKVRERLHHSELRFRGILEQSELAIFGYDQDGTLLFWNKRCEGIFGYGPEQVLGKKVFRILYTPWEREEIRKKTERMFKGEAVNSEDWVRVALDGKKIYLHTTFYGVRDESGRVVLGVSASLDITERLKLQEQLIQAQKMEAVGQLAGGIAHDFNNQLTVIIGNLKLALSELSRDETVYPRLADAEKAAEQCSEIVRGLLLFERRSISLDKHVLNANSILDEFEKLIRHLLPTSIEIQIKKNADKANIEGDATQIQQVLMNLAVNARDAMPGGGKLFMELQNVDVDESYSRKVPEARPGSFLCLTVTDTGAGIPPEILPRIFEPFFTTKKEGEGTGLGLSTVYAIVKLHDGWVHVYSEPGLGTTFKIYLPVSSGSAETPAKEDRSEITGGHETILVADDEDAILQLAKAILERNGYRVLVASDGEKLLSIYEKNSAGIHLILMDYTMPKLSAHDTLERIRAIRQDAKVIVSSGYGFTGPVAEELGRSGVTEFIQKPYHPDVLARTVRSVLDSNKFHADRQRKAA